MRILHVIPTYVPAYRYGGPIRSVHGLAEAQSAAGDAVEVYTTDADGPGRSGVPTDRPVAVGRHQARYFRAGFPRRLGRAPALGRALDRDTAGFDLLHLHSVFQWPTAVAASAARRAERPYLVSPRGMLVGELVARHGALRKRLWIALFERRILRGSARIVATSALEATQLRALGLDLAPVVEIPNGVDLDELAAPAPEEISANVRAAIAGGPYVLFLGRLSWKKRIDLFLSALARLDGCRGLIAGPDDEGLAPRLRRQAAECGVAARIDLLGEVRGADRVALLRGARALVLLSSSENFGNAALEALACGVPVVVTGAVGLAAEVGRRGAGRIVEPAAEAVAAGLGELLDDPAAAREAGARGSRLVAERFTWTAVARALRAVYTEVLAA